MLWFRCGKQQAALPDGRLASSRWRVAMTFHSNLLAAAIVAASATLAGLAVAAPIRAPVGVVHQAGSVKTVQFRGGNWGSNHPLMTGEGWNEQMRAWDAREGRQ